MPPDPFGDDSGFQPRPQMEYLIALRERDPAEFNDVITPALRVQMGYYAKEKAEHERQKEQQS